MQRADLIIEQHVPGHVKAININYQGNGKKDGSGVWYGAIFYYDEGAEASQHEADTLVTLLEMIEHEVFEDMPEDTPPDEVA